MAQPTEVYVDPAIAADSGTGTLADPYGDLEYAIEQTTFDTTNGTRVNIKSGTDEVLAAELSVALADTVTTVAWAPAETAPCVFQGYSSVAGDGGIGGISGGGSVGIFVDTGFSNIAFIDLHLHNSGATDLISLGSACSFIRCELNNTTADAINLTTYGLVTGCHIHDVGTLGINTTNVGHLISYNYLENETNDFSIAIQAVNSFVYRNICKLDGSSSGIRAQADYTSIINNSVWSNGGTGTGISVASLSEGVVIMNNIVEGFSGVGGNGYLMAADGRARIMAANAAFNNTTNYSGTLDWVLDDWKGTGDETLASTGFSDATNGDFSPLDVGSIKEGSLPEDFGDGQ